MDRVLISKDEKKTIYEIYRACRLCGAGAGYKMPIIQSVVDLESHGLELRQKIKKCIQIEVNHTDRMPPLICELCVDKVNDFYDFLTLCQQTNNKTRQRLGLPLQTKSRDSGCENCIFGVTEPINMGSDVEPPGQRAKRTKKDLDEQVKVKVGKANGVAAHSSRSSSPDARWERRCSPPRKKATRQNTDISIDFQFEDLPLPDSRSKLKRSREKETKIETPPPNKKVKLPDPKAKETPKPGPKSRKTTKESEPPKPATKEPEPPKTTSKTKPAPKKEIKPSPPATKPKSKSKPEPVKTKPIEEPVKPKPETLVKPKLPKPVETKFTCIVCDHQVKTCHGLYQHQLVKHLPVFTAAKFACNACELWFPTAEGCASHHRAHRDGLPYKCLRCYGYFKLQQEYESHFAENLCLSVYEVPDVQCWRCWKRFPTSALLSAHRCPGEDGRPGGKCSKCNRNYALLKNQLKHEATCAQKKKGEDTIDPEVQARLLPMQVKISRCDALLSGPRVDVARISHIYGLDSKARYPYLTKHIKRESSTKLNLVSTENPIKADWDSDSNDSQKVDSLTAMTLKTINKVNKGDDNEELANKIFSIIDNLGADDGLTSCDSDSLLEKVGADKKHSDDESKGDRVKGDVSDAHDDSQGGSDSILDKGDDKSVDLSRVNDESDKMEVVKDVINHVAESDTVVSGDDRVNSAVADETKVDSDNVDVNADKMDVDTEKVVEIPEKSKVCYVQLDDSEKIYGACKHSDLSTKKTDFTENIDNSPAKSEKSNEASKNCEEMLKSTELDKRLTGSEDKLITDLNDQNNERTDVEEKVDGEGGDKAPMDKALYESDNILHVDLKTSSKNDDEIDDSVQSNDKNEQISLTSKSIEEISNNDEENSVETQNVSPVNDNYSKNDNLDSNQSIQDCSLDFNKDKLECDIKESEKVDENDHKTEGINAKEEKSFPPLINNEVFSKIDEITNKILKETEISQDNTTDEHNAVEKAQKSDNHSDSISINSLRSVNDIELQDKFNVDDLSDDDKKLMAELDAQIGEINGNSQKIDDETANQNIEKNDQISSENDCSGNGHNDNVVINDNYANQGNTDNNISQTVNSNNQNGPSNTRRIEIRQTNEQRRESDQKSKDYLIDNLLKKQEDLKSLELDSISDDEFTFET